MKLLKPYAHVNHLSFKLGRRGLGFYNASSLDIYNCMVQLSCKVYFTFIMCFIYIFLIQIILPLLYCHFGSWLNGVFANLWFELYVEFCIHTGPWVFKSILWAHSKLHIRMIFCCILLGFASRCALNSASICKLHNSWPRKSAYQTCTV